MAFTAPSLKAKRKPPPWLKPVIACKPRMTESQPPPIDAHQAGLQQASSSSSGETAAPLPLTQQPCKSGTELALPLLATRRDAPKVNPSSGRGTRPDTVLTDIDRTRLLEAYESDARSKSAVASSESLWRTWEFYHTRWYLNGTPTLPLTAEKIIAVTAQMKERTYASVANTISVAKDHHLAQGFVWSEHLAREVKRATRTSTRGRGAPKQDAEIDLDASFELELGDSPLVSGGPCCANRLLEVGAFHILREIELSLALARSVHINDNIQEETFELPVSKTDPQAIGCSRSWGCVCSGSHDIPCAFHALKEQVAWLHDTFSAASFDTLPLFPDANGSPVQKSKVVLTIEKVTLLLGEPLTDLQGRNRFGGHTLRITGARRLARLSIPTPTIMLLARWASMVVLRYIREAPLKGLTQEYRRRAGAPRSSLMDISDSLDGRKRERIQTYAKEHADHEKKLTDLQERLDSLASSLMIPDYVMNTASGVYHRADTTQHSVLSAHARYTPCGWLYDGRNASTVKTIPAFASARLVCSRCLWSERLSRTLAVAASDSLSSSSESDDGTLGRKAVASSASSVLVAGPWAGVRAIRRSPAPAGGATAHVGARTPCGYCGTTLIARFDKTI